MYIHHTTYRPRRQHDDGIDSTSFTIYTILYTLYTSCIKYYIDNVYTSYNIQAAASTWRRNRQYIIYYIYYTIYYIHNTFIHNTLNAIYTMYTHHTTYRPRRQHGGRLGDCPQSQQVQFLFFLKKYLVFVINIFMNNQNILL